MATVADLLTSVRYQIRDGGTNKWTGAELIDYVNRGYRLVWARLVQLRSDFVKKLNPQTLTINLEQYALPADFWSVDFLQIEGETKPMSAVDMSYVEMYNANLSADLNVPMAYAIYNGYFYIRPIPDGAYMMNEYYFYKPSDLDSTDTTPFNGIADEAFIAYVTEMALAREEHNTARNQSAVSSLLRMTDILFKRRDKQLKRVDAYRWEYEGMV
jgi:hypothetical protein